MKLDDLNIYDVGHTIQLAGALYADGETIYLLPLPGELTDAQLDALGTAERSIGDMVRPFIQVLDMDLPDWKRFIRQTDLLEVEIMTYHEGKGDQKLAKAIIRKSQRQISQGVSWAVYRRDEYACRYCGANDIPLTVDHLVLWEDGGPSIEANLLASCRKCNKIRGSIQYEVWLNHPFYLKVSHGISETARRANSQLVSTLDAILRMKHKPSKR